MALTELQVKAAQSKAKPYSLTDANGLHLYVTEKGHKHWHFRYRLDGKQPRISLGTYPHVTLKMAREFAAECRVMLARGTDPGQKRKQDKQESADNQTKTFSAAAELWYGHKEKTGKSKSSLDKMRTYLDKDILPLLKSKPVASITRADCTRVQERIEARKAYNVAKKVRNWLREIFSQSIARGWCEYNPASELRTIAIPAPKSKPYPHLREPELPGFLCALSQSTSRQINRTAAWMTIWTATRPGIVRWAEWAEIDLDKATWTVPAAKMKMREPFTTPLPTQLVAALKELHKLTGRQRWLFPGIGTKNEVISENTICQVFHRIGYKGRMVGHGSRHTASTLLRDHRWHKDLVEAQLAHKEAGSAGDYNFAAYLIYRRTMMQWYADYLDALRVGMNRTKADKFARRVNAAPSGGWQRIHDLKPKAN